MFHRGTEQAVRCQSGMRPLLLAAAAAAILVPVAVWYRPARPPAAPAAELERPDSVFAAQHLDHLPFGLPGTRLCDCNHVKAALLVQEDAIWLGTNTHPSSPARIPRDGTEWAVLEPALLSLAQQDVEQLEVAVHDDARYEDLLSAMLLARSTGLQPRVIQPGLPVYPHHGHGGGLPLRF